MPFGHPSRDDEYAIGDRSLELRRSVFKFTNMGVINIHVVFKTVKPKELTKEGCTGKRRTLRNSSGPQVQH